MSAAVLFALVIGIFATATLVVMMWALLRHLKVLLAALKLYMEEVQPLLEEIQAASESARTRAEQVPGRLPRGLPGRNPGVRLRM